MGDLTIETATYCATNEFWETEVVGSTGKPYKVRFERTLNGLYQYDWTCTCPAFQHRGRRLYCKHIEDVKAGGQRCGWNKELEPFVRAAEDGTCPSCGGPVKHTRVGV